MDSDHPQRETIGKHPLKVNNVKQTYTYLLRRAARQYACVCVHGRVSPVAKRMHFSGRAFNEWAVRNP